jgi:hypothetical protein
MFHCKVFHKTPNTTHKHKHQRMRLVNGKYNANPAKVADVLVNILNNFKLDQQVINVIIYIITNTTACDMDKQVSDFEPTEPSVEQLKKLNQDYKTFQQQHRFKTLQEFMATDKDTLFQRIERLVQENITEDFIEGLKTKNGDTQSSERPIIARICEILDANQITYTQASSQASKDFRNINGTGLNIEVKKTDKTTIIFNDTLPSEHIYYILFVTGKKTKKSEIKPQLIFMNGSKFVEDSPWVKEYEAELTAMKDKWARGEGKKQLSGCISVYPRPTYKADISAWIV